MGGLLRETFEDTLVPWLEECGTLYDLRIMTNPNDGVNKGFAFAIFCSPDDAKTAVRKVIVMFHNVHSVLKNILRKRCVIKKLHKRLDMIFVVTNFI